MASHPPPAPQLDAAAPRPALSAQAYAAIKQRIITLAYPPGEYLNETAVARALGIGRTPVHQALNRLMLEGLVEVIPRKGVIVKPVSLHEVLQIVETRLAVEPYAVGLAAQRAQPPHLAQLAHSLQQAGPAVAARDVTTLMQLDREFHRTIAAAANNAVLGEVLRNLHDRSLRFWFIALTDPDHLAAVQTEHAAILTALRARDPRAAADCMRDHIRAFGAHIAQRL
jgi:DNA-binding GntR family transcriptional regulator